MRVEKIAVKPRRSLCKVAKSCLKSPTYILHKKIVGVSDGNLWRPYEVVHEKKTTKRNLFYCNDKIAFVRDDGLPKRCRDRFIPYCETKIFLNF